MSPGKLESPSEVSEVSILIQAQGMKDYMYWEHHGWRQLTSVSNIRVIYLTTSVEVVL